MTDRGWLIILIGASIGVGMMALNLGDFNRFYQAGRAILSGVNPYTVPGFYSPIYVALAFVPLTLLPLPIAFRLFAGFVFLSFGLAFYALTNRRIKMTILLMCSPLPLMTAWYGNLESIVLIGSLIAPVIGILLVMSKPQIGLIVALLFVWKARPLPNIARLIVPVGCLYAISFALGMWRTTPIAETWSIRLWPIGLAFGIPAAIIALRRCRIDWALFAGPFCAPYLGAPFAFIGTMPLLAQRRGLAVAGVVAAWIITIYWRMRL